MFGTLGGPELFLIFVVALIVFGPRKLPEIGKSLGKMMAEFRKASNEFRSTIESEVETEKIRESMRIEPPKVDRAPASQVYSPPEPAAASTSPASPPGDEAAPETHEGSPDTPAGAAAAEAGPETVPETVSRQPTPAPIEPK